MTTTNYALNQIAFLEKFGTQRGRWLANRLNLTGKNSEKLANSVSGFFWNLTAAIVVDKKNDMKAKNKTPNTYAQCCKFIYEDNIISSDRYSALPVWVRADIENAIKMLNNRR